MMLMVFFIKLTGTPPNAIAAGVANIGTKDIVSILFLEFDLFSLHIDWKWSNTRKFRFSGNGWHRIIHSVLTINLACIPNLGYFDHIIIKFSWFLFDFAILICDYFNSRFDCLSSIEQLPRLGFPTPASPHECNINSKCNESHRQRNFEFTLELVCVFLNIWNA